MYVVSRFTGVLFLFFAGYMALHSLRLLKLQQAFLSTNLHQPVDNHTRIIWGCECLLITFGLLAFGLRLILKPVRLDQQISW